MQQYPERASDQTRQPTIWGTIWRIGFVLTTATILLITMWPNPVDAGMGTTVQAVLDALHRLGVPASFGYDELEFTANIVMFMPFGLFLALGWPVRVVTAALTVVCATVAIETTQWFLLEGRYGTLLDVLANSLGGWIGISVAIAARALSRR